MFTVNYVSRCVCIVHPLCYELILICNEGHVSLGLFSRITVAEM